MLCFVKSSLISFFISTAIFGANIALIVGRDANSPYATFLDETGMLIPIEGLPPTGLLYRTAMNVSGLGLIGGVNGVNAYASFVHLDGTLLPLSGLIAPGEIYTVALNASNAGIIGGGHQMTNIPYAALVNLDGTVTSLMMPASGLIFSVAIDPTGRGLIGGVGPANSAYASITTPSGVVTPIAGLPASGGIFWVALNQSGLGLIGGNDGPSIYAAYVDITGTATSIPSLPPGILYEVAINDSGTGIIAGESLNIPYAAIVRADGSSLTLSNTPTTQGIMYGAAINNSGEGLIVGFSTTGLYGGHVSPDGSVIPFRGLPSGVGFLEGVAIHPTGLGLVSGQLGTAAYAALVAPNGNVTSITGLPINGELTSVAFNGLIPSAIGPFDSFANVQFALSNVLTQHAMIHHKDLFVDDPSCECKCAEDTFWISIFGDHVLEQAQCDIFEFSNDIFGFLLGYDYLGYQDMVFGGGFSYAFNDVKYKENLGSAEINQEALVIYASWDLPRFYINAALWGGIAQISHERRSLAMITSKATPSAWNLSPHIEASMLMQNNRSFAIEPFIMFDWANNWQYDFREKGASGFNIILSDQYLALFRSELGLRFYQRLSYSLGDVTFEEKVSYVNRTPFHNELGRAIFVGALSSFDVETLSGCTQNLVAFQAHVEYFPKVWRSIYGAMDYQGEYSSSFQSHMLTISIGKNF